MSHAVLLRCTCDECGTSAEFDCGRQLIWGPPVTDVRGHEAAAEAGWYVNTVRPRTLCPICTREVEP